MNPDARLAEHDLTPREQGIVDMVRLNAATPVLEIRRNWQIGRWQFAYSRRSRKNLWGRFGGGWDWKLGIDIGGTTVILNLLVSSLRISKAKS